MLQATMTPYVKRYDKNGVLLNPVGTIKNTGLNRSQRRRVVKRIPKRRATTNYQRAKEHIRRVLKIQKRSRAKNRRK